MYGTDSNVLLLQIHMYNIERIIVDVLLPPASGNFYASKWNFPCAAGSPPPPTDFYIVHIIIILQQYAYYVYHHRCSTLDLIPLYSSIGKLYSSSVLHTAVVAVQQKHGAQQYA